MSRTQTANRELMYIQMAQAIDKNMPQYIQTVDSKRVQFRNYLKTELVDIISKVYLQKTPAHYKLENERLVYDGKIDKKQILIRFLNEYTGEQQTAYNGRYKQHFVQFSERLEDDTRNIVYDFAYDIIAREVAKTFKSRRINRNISLILNYYSNFVGNIPELLSESSKLIEEYSWKEAEEIVQETGIAFFSLNKIEQLQEEEEKRQNRKMTSQED